MTTKVTGSLMNLKATWLFFIGIFAIGPAGAVRGESRGNAFLKGKTDIASLAREALRNNPDLKQLEQRILEARARISQVKAWPDPSLGIALSNMPFSPFSLEASPMTGIQFTFSQLIPFPGRLSQAGRVASKMVAIEKAQLREARLKLAGFVRFTALKLIFLAADRDISRKHRKILDGFIVVADTKFKVMRGLMQDTLKARVARGQVMDRLQKIARAREAVEASLNALLGRGAGARVSTIVLPELRRLTRTLPELIALARKQRPLLEVWKGRMDAAKLKKNLARYGYTPDFGVSLGYRLRKDSGMEAIKGMDFWNIGVNLRIPLWSLGKTRGAIREAKAALSRSSYGYESALLMIQKAVRTARDGILRLEKRLKIYNQLILPQARQALKAATHSYTVGKIDFLRVLDHQRELFRHQIGYWRIRIERARQWEALQTALGKEL